MKKYVIAIEEMISDNFEVEAETAEEAMELAEYRYRTGEYALAPGNLVAKQIAIISPNNAITEWTEF